MSGVEIIGLGSYAPSRRVPNEDLEHRLGLDAGWIRRRTGIVARRYAADGEALSDLAIEAGQSALRSSGIERRSVALLLLATSTPDHLLPPTAPLVAHRLGLASAGAIDMAGACAGFIYALSVADAFVRTHQAPVLVIAANVLSRRINVLDRASSVLFADAAGAVLLAPSKRTAAGLAGVSLSADGSAYNLIRIEAGGSRVPFSPSRNASDYLMAIENGRAVFTAAVRLMTTAAQQALQRSKLTAADVTRFIPHQANARLMTEVSRRLSIADSQTVSTIAEYANSSAATIPFSLAVSAAQRAIEPQEIVLMTAAGAGMTAGAAVWRW